MPNYELAPTKSNLLTLKHQLAVAEEGYDLLEQKRQVLIVEMMRLSTKGKQLELTVSEALRQAYATLHEAVLETGSNALDYTAHAVQTMYQERLAARRMMGLILPEASSAPENAGPHFGLGGTTASMDITMRRFTDLIPLLTELAGLQTTVCRLARELRKTQRRCNALSRVFLPDCHRAIERIAAALEERERESLIVLKRIRDNQRGKLGQE